MTAGAILRYARSKAGLSQRDLASRTGVLQPAISRIERRRVDPGVDMLERLLAACSMSLGVLPCLGLGVDRSAIRELLRLSPAERARLATEEAKNLAGVGGDLRGDRLR